MKRGRRPVVLALMMVLVGMVFVLPARPAAAASCGSPSSCDNHSPQTTGCSADAVSLQTVSISNGRGKVELRYSPSCKTAWSRVTSWIGPTRIDEWINRSVPQASFSDTDFNATQAYSPMAYMYQSPPYSFSSLAQACGKLASTYSNCTDFH